MAASGILGKKMETGAYICYGVGAAAVVTGIIIWAVSGKEPAGSAGGVAVEF